MYEGEAHVINIHKRFSFLVCRCWSVVNTWRCCFCHHSYFVLVPIERTACSLLWPLHNMHWHPTPIETLKGICSSAKYDSWILCIIERIESHLTQWKSLSQCVHKIIQQTKDAWIFIDTRETKNSSYKNASRKKRSRPRRKKISYVIGHVYKYKRASRFPLNIFRAHL